MEFEARMSYLERLFYEIREGVGEKYTLACSELKTWCTILTGQEERTEAEREKVAKLEKRFDSYQKELATNLNKLRDLKTRLGF